MATNDYSRRSKKDVFWGDDDNKNSKSDELDELFREEHKTLEEDTQTNVPEPVFEPEPEPVYEPEPELEEIIDDEGNHNDEENPDGEEENSDWEENIDGEEDDAYEGDYNSTEIADDAVPFMTSPGWNGLGYAPSVVLGNAPDELPPEEQSDANPMPKSITINKYTPQHQSDTQLNTNIEQLSHQYEDKVSNLVNFKIIALLVIIGILIASIYVGYYDSEMISFCWLASIIGCFIIGSISQSKYAEVIKELVKSFKVIDSYTHDLKNTYQKVCTNIFRFPKFSADDCDYYREDLTEIKIGDTTISATELLVSHTTGSGKNSHTDLLFTGEYYTFVMPKPYADGVLVCKGTMPVIEPNKYYDCKYRFYATNNNMPNSDFGHITHIVDRLSENYKEDFALYFENGKAHLIVNTNTLLFFDFDFGFWDFSVKDKLKRDVPRLAMRVKIAGILTE